MPPALKAIFYYFGFYALSLNVHNIYANEDDNYKL